MPEAIYNREKKTVKVKKNSQFRETLKQLSYNRMAMLGAILFILELTVCLAAPLFTRYGYNALDFSSMFESPSLRHFFGTDNLGRDIFTRVLYGGRYSITMGLFSVVISMAVGSVLGSLAGFFGGWVDSVVMRLLDVIQALPSMLLTIVISAALGSGYFNTILALSVNGIPQMARLLRAQMMQVRNNEYIEAAESINCSKVRIIVSHLFPNSFSPLLVQGTMAIGNRILMAASLSFIGLGVQPPSPEWGAMLSDARTYMRGDPHMVIFPGLAIALTVLAVNLMGDGLRDALDPKMKR